MFLGPLEAVNPLSEKVIEGVHRFLRKVHRECFRADKHLDEEETDKQTLRLLHETILKVTESIEDLRFNVAISQMMILINQLQKVENYSLDTSKPCSNCSLLSLPIWLRNFGNDWEETIRCQSSLA